MGCLAIMDAAESISCTVTDIFLKDGPPLSELVQDAVTPGI